MRSVRFDRLLAGSALALVLALSSHGALAQVDEAQIEAAMPPVDTADVPPPSIKDIGPLPSAAAPPAAADTGTPLATQSAAEHAKPAEQPATAAGQSDAPKAAEGDNGRD